MIAHRLQILTTFACLVFAGQTGAQSVQNSESAADRDARMAWWRDARFGMFIHWGVYSIPARGEWYMFNQKVPVAEYEKYPPAFNPVQFNARQWVRLAKAAGMKYIVITSKHHDGFCMWGSKAGSYNIIDRTPFARDPLKELAVACKEEGIRLCFYHSIMDWHHPDATGARFPKYRDGYLKPQLKELLTEYGPIGVLWFDGEWISEWTAEEGIDLYNYVRSLQPGIIINNRVGKGRNGMAGLNKDPDAAGDFGTPEQEIPPTGLPGIDWESCMTMNDNWGFASRDSNWKSTSALVRNLIDIASKGGNYLLNVGPTSLGTIPDASILRLEEIGKWMNRYGESIYGTQASPFDSTPWGRSTQKHLADGKTVIYFHVFEWPADGSLLVTGLGSKPSSARLLGDQAGTPAITYRGDTAQIALPSKAPDEICSVIALEFPGRVTTYHPPSLSADVPIFIDHAMVTITSPSPEMDVRYTLDGSLPTVTSPRYTGPIVLLRSAVVKARCFHSSKPVSQVTEIPVMQVPPEPASQINGLVPGVSYSYFEGGWESLPEFSTLTPVGRGSADRLDLAVRKRDEHFGVVFSGYVQVPSTAVYAFGLSSDDGSRLSVDGRLIVDNDGLHGARERVGYLALEKGLHPITVSYFNNTGDHQLSLTLTERGKPPIREPLFFHVQ
jgi:alpha-L-fucosidase